MKAQKKHRKILLVILVLVIAVGAVGYLGLGFITKSYWPFAQSKEQTKSADGINYTPPTRQEIESSQDGKKNSEDKPAQNLETVAVDVAYAGISDDGATIDIRAFTADVIEGTGTCTATLTRGSEIVTASSKAFVDARSSICEPIEIPLDKFSSNGSWSLTVAYESPAYKGTSTPVDLEVSR